MTYHWGGHTAASFSWVIYGQPGPVRLRKKNSFQVLFLTSFFPSTLVITPKTSKQKCFRVHACEFVVCTHVYVSLRVSCRYGSSHVGEHVQDKSQPHVLFLKSRLLCWDGLPRLSLGLINRVKAAPKFWTSKCLPQHRLLHIGSEGGIKVLTLALQASYWLPPCLPRFNSLKHCFISCSLTAASRVYNDQIET